MDGKAYVRVRIGTPANKLSLRQRLAYSLMACFPGQWSRRRLARRLGMDRRTADKIIASLAGIEHDGLWRPRKGKGDGWAYFRLYLPATRAKGQEALSLADAALYSLLLSKNMRLPDSDTVKNHTPGYFALCLGTDRRSVRRSLDRLVLWGLLDKADGVYSLQPLGDRATLFRDQSRPKPAEEPAALPSPDEFMAGLGDTEYADAARQRYEELIAAGVSKAEAAEFATDLDVATYRRCVERAKKEHRERGWTEETRWGRLFVFKAARELRTAHKKKDDNNIQILMNTVNPSDITLVAPALPQPAAVAAPEQTEAEPVVCDYCVATNYDEFLSDLGEHHALCPNDPKRAKTTGTAGHTQPTMAGASGAG